MGRSVVNNPTVRCVRCQQVPRWCVCEGLRVVECPLAVDVMRAVRLEQRGYRVRTQTIPALVTLKNRLLLGEPG